MTFTICEADGYWVVQTNRDGEQGAGIHVAYSWEDALRWAVETAWAIIDFGLEPPTRRADREQMARDAFWGTNDLLWHHLRGLAGYGWDGQRYAANTLTLEECIALVHSLSESDLDALQAVGAI